MERVAIESKESDLFPQFWKIYQTSFPLHEQRTLERQIKAFEKESYRVDAVTENGEFIGFITWWEFETFLYVEHYALNPLQRNRGYGSNILSYFSETNSSKNIILEIDPPLDDISKRREQFYKRLDYVTNNHKHIHPPYNEGESSFELIIMTYKKPLTEDEFLLFKAEHNKIIGIK